MNKKIKIRKKIGLALGSGAARGLAHIGVLKVFERNNIPIDYIAGSSIGAVIGAFYATSKNVAEMERVITTADWRLYLSLIDPGVTNGIIRGNKIRNFLARYLGEASFGELKVPLSIVATDFQTGETVIINKGNLIDAIMASSAIPLVFQPAKIDGRMLVDGGLSAPIPVQALKKMGANKIIGVNLDADYFTKKREVFSAGVLALRTIQLLRYHLSARDAVVADIVIEPEVGELMDYSFLSGKKAIEAGERAAQKVIPVIKKLIR